MLKNSLLLFLLLSSCSSAPTKKDRIDVPRFEAIKLGQSIQSATSVLGKPSNIIRGNEHDPDETWIYEDETGAQSGAISMETRTQSITGVTIIPKETDPEYHLDHLLKTKFPSMVFEKVPLSRCRRDYVPLEVFYIQAREGVVIQGNRRGDEVRSFSRTTPEHAADLLRQIRDCKR